MTVINIHTRTHLLLSCNSRLLFLVHVDLILGPFSSVVTQQQFVSNFQVQKINILVDDILVLSLPRASPPYLADYYNTENAAIDSRSPVFEPLV